MKTTDTRASNREAGLKIFTIGRALKNPLRQKILDLIEEHTSLNVTEIWTKLRIKTHSQTCQHLAILREAGIVNTSRLGKETYYSLNTDMDNCIFEAVQILNNSTLEAERVGD